MSASISESGKIPLLRIRFDQVDRIPNMIDHLMQNPNYYLDNHNTYLSNEDYWSAFKFDSEKSMVVVAASL